MIFLVTANVKIISYKHRSRNTCGNNYSLTFTPNQGSSAAPYYAATLQRGKVLAF